MQDLPGTLHIDFSSAFFKNDPKHKIRNKPNVSAIFLNALIVQCEVSPSLPQHHFHHVTSTSKGVSTSPRAEHGCYIFYDLVRPHDTIADPMHAMHHTLPAACANTSMPPGKPAPGQHRY
jgi:hypothetical protein